MKTHSTNYFNTLIQIAEDCPVSSATTPPVKNGKLTIANFQFELIQQHPYQFTSDDVLFQQFADKQHLTADQLSEARSQFFSKGQACMRASSLGKRYGWGIHFDADGKMALIASESEKYADLSSDPSIVKIRAMKSKR